MTDLSPAVAAPDHVPPALIYDFDMFRDAALVADPHERIREIIRDAPPVFWTAAIVLPLLAFWFAAALKRRHAS